MTANAREPGMHQIDGPMEAPIIRGPRPRFRRPRWLLPALAAGLVAAALYFAGLVPLSTLLYAGMAGGMLLMHLGGHGMHGGHGGGGGHRDHGGTTDEDVASSGRIGTPDEAPDDTTLDGRGPAVSADRAEHRSHGCH